MKTNNLIVILTDFGLKDGFVGTMKGVIYSINPEARIVDLCHDISPQDIRQADFLLRTSAKYFPEGTVFLVVVDPGVGTGRKAIILKTGGALYVAPDNGVLTGIYRQEKAPEVIEITNKDYFLPEVSRTFHGRDIFSPVSAYLSRGTDPGLMGEKLDSIKLLEEALPSIDEEGRICGTVIYIDKFGNLITNLSEVFLEKNIKTDEKIIIKLKKQRIKGFSQSYGESAPGNVLAIIGSSGYLEIAVNQGSAEKYLNCRPGEKLYIERAHTL